MEGEAVWVSLADTRLVTVPRPSHSEQMMRWIKSLVRVGSLPAWADKRVFRVGYAKEFLLPRLVRISRARE